MYSTIRYFYSFYSGVTWDLIQRRRGAPASWQKLHNLVWNSNNLNYGTSDKIKMVTWAYRHAGTFRGVATVRRIKLERNIH